MNREEHSGSFFYVGTYTDGDSQSNGIYKFFLNKEGILEQKGLVARTNNPSFLCRTADGQFLVSVNETDIENAGSVESYAILGDSLLRINRSTTGGAHPCFVSVDKNGYVLCANYTGGNISLHKLDLNGNLSALLFLQQHEGTGTHERQKSPHAHSCYFDPFSDQIISVDLGTNELWFSKLDTSQYMLLPASQPKIKLPEGAGPRHLAFHPAGKWLYVINELNSTITKLQRTNRDTLTIKESVSTLPENYSSESYCADVHISDDGHFLYASNRGHNSIAVFSIDQGSGSLTLVGHQSTMGDWPRNFAISPDQVYLLVANQRSQNIVSFKRNTETGMLQFVGEIDAPSPVCILF